MLFKPRTFHPVQYILIALAVTIATIIKVHVPIIGSGRPGLIYYSIVVIASLYGDYLAGILAIILCGLGLNYVVPPVGFNLDSATVLKAISFWAEGAFIYWLAWHTRRVQMINDSLHKSVEEIREVIGQVKNKNSTEENKAGKMHSRKAKAQK
ncbi:hypothetical protein BVY00_00485, partial [bacterium G20]